MCERLGRRGGTEGFGSDGKAGCYVLSVVDGKGAGQGAMAAANFALEPCATVSPHFLYPCGCVVQLCV